MGNVLKIGVAVTAALIVAGCSGPPSFTEDEKRELRGSASSYQQDVLEDLVVTESEYRDAVDRTRSCVQDKGWGVSGIERDGNQVGFTASYSSDNGPSSEEMQACYSEFLAPIGPIWLSQRESLTS